MENQEFRRPRISLTRTLRVPNYYTNAIDNEFKDVAFNEERAPLNIGKWRSDVLKVDDEMPLDLEIGTGNGVHFQHRAFKHPERCIVGVELKYKPLIQTIRGALRKGAKNAAICRYHAFNVDELFKTGELNNVFIHFPDPWTSPRKPSNRFVNDRVLDILFDRQRPGSELEFKTDSREYFLWSMEHIRKSKYKILFETLDMHSTEVVKTNVITQFEKIFMKKGVPINFVRLLRE